MKRITVSLPEDLAFMLADDARRQRRSVSDLVREAVEKELGVHPECEPKPVPFARIGRSKDALPARNVDKYLKDHWLPFLREEMGER